MRLCLTNSCFDQRYFLPCQRQHDDLEVYSSSFEFKQEDMKTFTSDISGKPYPISERISGKLVRNGVLKEILKVSPSFNESSCLSVSEYNEYRQQYIQNLLSKEVGTLTELEQTVLENIRHNHILADEVSEVKRDKLSTAQRCADKLASFGGSWKFIISFGVFIIIWIFINAYSLQRKGFDPYPFILLNLILSCIAALQAPVIMMSQNRQEEKDRERAKNDYMVNLKSELEIRMLHEKIDHVIITQQENLLEIQQVQTEMIREMTKAINNYKNHASY
jgi:uncharacterized membrane protein